MTSEQAYEVVFRFLVQFWTARKEDYDENLPELLGSMDRTIWSDGAPGDPAYEEIWKESSYYKTEMTPDETFAAMIKLLEDYIAIGQGSERDIERLLMEVKSDPQTHRDIFGEIVRKVMS